MTAQDSRAANHLFFQKLQRAVRRKPHVFRDFFRETGTISETNQPVVQASRTRFDACVDHLVRALYFHDTEQKWRRPIFVASPSFFAQFNYGQVVPHQASLEAIALLRTYLVAEPIRGENPEVFRYRLRYEHDTHTLSFAGQFYDLLEVFAYSSRELDGVAA